MKYKIVEGSRLEGIETEEGILFRPKKSTVDLAGSGTKYTTPEEMKKRLTSSGKKMPKTVYGTRFFIEHYYSKDGEVLRRTTQEVRKTKERYISAIVLHEVYQLTLEREGRETAVLRTHLLEKTSE